jgi:hypothetical protein
MNATLSSETQEPQETLDQTMRVVARNVAMGIHDLNEILTFCNVSTRDFTRWKDHPRFLKYVAAETEAWNNASNVGERTKLKAGIVMEEFMEDAYVELKDRKTPLNQRVLLGQLVAKIAGMGEPKGIGLGVSDGGGGFTLQINIGQHAHVQYSNENLKTIDAEPEPEAPDRMRPMLQAIETELEEVIKPKNIFQIINDDLGTPDDE